MIWAQEIIVGYSSYPTDEDRAGTPRRCASWAWATPTSAPF